MQPQPWFWHHQLRQLLVGDVQCAGGDDERQLDGPDVLDVGRDVRLGDCVLRQRHRRLWLLCSKHILGGCMWQHGAVLFALDVACCFTTFPHLHAGRSRVQLLEARCRQRNGRLNVLSNAENPIT